MTKLSKKNIIFILRNIFYQFNISETANLLYQLKACLDPGSVVYAQNTANLPVAERNHEGWEPDSVAAHLQFADFDLRDVPAEGKCGTRRYAGTLQSNGPEISDLEVLRKCYELLSRPCPTSGSPSAS